jgi:hypothetical protein
MQQQCTWGSEKTKETEEYRLLHSSGVSINSLPNIEFVTDSLRREIIAGKDVNLASLLIPQFKESMVREVCVGEESLSIKPMNDKRLSRPLTISEFSMAFNKYRNVMCQAYPSRRQELDDYYSQILKMSQHYGGFGFYEYHKQFSFKAAQYLRQLGKRVNWAIRDDELYMSIFTGQKTNSCAVCFSIAHLTNFCPEKANSPYTPQRPWSSGNNNYGGSRSIDKRGRQVTTHNQKQICNNFNGASGCKFEDRCYNSHICFGCKKPHPQIKCPNIKPNSMGNRPLGKPIPTTN